VKFLRKSWKSRLALFIAVVGPGLIAGAGGNDAGGIWTYSVVGARIGYSMLWAMIPTTVALIVVQEMAARMGAVTGKG
jgi:Mn2+/Fe2+ NRAMP family transporter